LHGKSSSLSSTSSPVSPSFVRFHSSLQTLLLDNNELGSMGVDVFVNSMLQTNNNDNPIALQATSTNPIEPNNNINNYSKINNAVCNATLTWLSLSNCSIDQTKSMCSLLQQHKTLTV
jgi:hypothetical protein